MRASTRSLLKLELVIGFLPCTVMLIIGAMLGAGFQRRPGNE